MQSKHYDWIVSSAAALSLARCACASQRRLWETPRQCTGSVDRVELNTHSQTFGQILYYL